MEDSDIYELQSEIGEFVDVSASCLASVEVDQSEAKVPATEQTHQIKIDDIIQDSGVDISVSARSGNCDECRYDEIELIRTLFGGDYRSILVSNTNRKLGNFVLKAIRRDSGVTDVIKLQLIPDEEDTSDDPHAFGGRIPRTRFEREMILTSYFGNKLLPGKTPKVRKTGKLDVTKHIAFQEKVRQGIFPSMVPYMLMDYVAGGTADNLKDVDDINLHGNVFTDVAYAIAIMHAKGIVHRDIKPVNILIEPNHRAKLADFGTATRRSSMNEILGTIPYISPSQLKADAGHELTDKEFARIDLYSLGLTMHEVAVGRHPLQSLYDQGNVAYLTHLAHDDPVELIKTGNSVLDDAIHRCVTNNPKEMYESPTELAKALNKEFRKEVLVFPAA